MICETQS